MSFQSSILSFSFFLSMKKEFMKGLMTSQFDKLYSPITLIYCLFGIFITSPQTAFPMIEWLLIVDIYRKIETRRELIIFLVRHVISRCVMGILLYIAIDEDFWLLFLVSPLLLCWYIFDPYLIRNKRLSFSERLDYFVSRFPYFIGYATLPLSIIGIWYFTEVHYLLYFTVCLMIRHQSELGTPKCYYDVPYTKVTYKTDPADIAEEYITQFF